MDSLKKNHLLDLTVELAKTPSISGTHQERVMGDVIQEHLMTIPYFQENSDHIFAIPIPEDTYRRISIAALLKGQGDRTIILLNHHDVVDILDYGAYGELAFDPHALTLALHGKPLPLDAQRDLESGDYLFGRGVADMKGGIAVQLSLLHALSREDLPGNILFLSVCDEETSSLGILSSLPFLIDLKEKEGLEYRAVINCEPSFPSYPGDTKNYIYTGSIGKALVFFSFYGQETHAGDSLGGLNANLMASQITSLLEGNVDFCDGERELLSPPPTCLKQMDLKRLYSAQIPHHAISYFNFLLHQTGPEELLRRLKKICYDGFLDLLKKVEENRRRYCWARDIDYAPSLWEPKVYLFSDLYREVEERVGAFVVKEEIEAIYKKHGKELDERELAFKLVDRIYDLCLQKDPMIIIGLLPPYYPAVKNSPGEEEITKKIEDIIKVAEEEYGESLATSSCFPGLSDLSYFSLKEHKEMEEWVKPNLPGWGLTYSLPLLTMKELNVPVINLGVQGRDAHKYTERMNLTYSFEVLPKLLYQLVVSLL